MATQRKTRKRRPMPRRRKAVRTRGHTAAPSDYIPDAHLDECPWSPQLGFTQSLIASFKKCPLLCAMKLHGWRSRAPKEAMEYGNLFHEILEVTYALDLPRSWRSGQRDLVDCAEQVIDEWIARMASEPDGLPMGTLERLGLVASATFPQYIQHYKDDYTTAVTWEEMESEFAVDVTHLLPSPPSCPALLRGKRDGLMRDDVDRSLWLMEHKTKGQVSQDIQKVLMFDPQNLHYITATEAERGEPVAGVLYNIIRRPGTKPHKGESDGAYMDRLGADIAKRPTHYFMRHPLRYLPHRVEAFRLRLGLVIEEFYQWYQNARPTFHHECSCIGRYTCEFLPACSANNLVGFQKTDGVFDELEDVI